MNLLKKIFGKIKRIYCKFVYYNLSNVDYSFNKRNEEWKEHVKKYYGKEYAWVFKIRPDHLPIKTPTYPKVPEGPFPDNKKIDWDQLEESTVETVFQFPQSDVETTIQYP